jgi:hypothetical protein
MIKDNMFILFYLLHKDSGIYLFNPLRFSEALHHKINLLEDICDDSLCKSEYHFI